jgi:hypothetical protein
MKLRAPSAMSTAAMTGTTGHRRTSVCCEPTRVGARNSAATARQAANGRPKAGPDVFQQNRHLFSRIDLADLPPNRQKGGSMLESSRRVHSIGYAPRFARGRR